MGNCCGSHNKKGTNGKKQKPGDKKPPRGHSGITAVIVGVGYEKYDNLYDPQEMEFADIKNNPGRARDFEDLCKKSDAKVTTLIDDSKDKNTYPTRENVLKAIKDAAHTMNKDNMFVFYYAGLGCRVQDQGEVDELDGMDEGLCLPDENGTIGLHANLIDDDLQDAIKEIDTDCRMLIVLDTDYGMDLLDIQDKDLRDHEIVLITANQDYPLTEQILFQVDKLDGKKGDLYSIGDVWNRLVTYAVSNEYSDFINIQFTPELQAKPYGIWEIPWPLSPQFNVRDREIARPGKALS
jgi:hypothetical protein